MELQISHSVCTEVQKKSVLQRKKTGGRRNSKNTVQLEEDKNRRGRSLPVPCAYVEKYPELKYKYRNREFWCRGYYVDTAGKNAKKIQEYIQKQLEEDKAGEQLTMGNF